METLRCKICGGPLRVDSVQSVAICDCCGAKQPMPLTYDPYGASKDADFKTSSVSPSGANPAALFRRASMALEDGDFSRADMFYEQILNQDPENAEAYVGKLLAELRLKQVSELAGCAIAFEGSPNYKRALQFADTELKQLLLNAVQAVRKHFEDQKKSEFYQQARHMLKHARDIPTCKRAYRMFAALSGYLDADHCKVLCEEQIQVFQKEWEQLRKTAKNEREAHRIAVRKAGKRLLIIGIAIVIAVLLSFGAYISIFRVVIPNNRYQEALTLAEDERYDDAISLLESIKDDAFFVKMTEKIENAIASIQKAQSLAEVVDNAEKEIDTAIADGGESFDDDVCNTVIKDLLAAGISVELIFKTDGGVLNADGDSSETRFLYQTKDSFDGVVDAQKTGYRFLGWTFGQYHYQILDQTFRIVLDAKFSEKAYLIRYELDGGKATNPTEYGAKDEAFTLTAPEKEGYTFIGWTGTDLESPTMAVTIASGSHGDRLYTAHWKANSYAVSFDPAGGTVADTETTYTYDQAVTLPTPQKTAYTFAGWYNGTKKVESGTWKLTSDVQLVAKWTPTTYRITYDLGGVPAKNPNQTGYTVESDTIKLGNMTYQHCTFEGWYSDKKFQNRVTEIPKGTAQNITLYAKWNIATFTVEYDWNGGNEITSQKTTYTVLDLPLSLGKPKKDGHDFYYWALGDIDGEPIDAITSCGNYKVVANYIPDGLEISWVHGGRREGYWCESRYWGDLTKIEIPKYHRMTHNSQIDNPYIQTVLLISAPNLTEISFSDEVIEIEAPKDSPVVFYENGKYVGSRNNPYHSLIGKQDPNSPVTTIHEDTVFIDQGVFNGDATLTSIVIPKNVKYIATSAFMCPNLAVVYNLSSLDIQVGQNALDHGGVGYYAVKIHTSLDEESVISYTEIGDFRFEYRKTTDTYTLIQYLGNAHELALPEDINGCPYRIRAGAFSNADIVSIVIPEKVTAIEQDAFEGCYRLLEIYNLSSLAIKAEYSDAHGGIGRYAVAVHTLKDAPSLLHKQGDYYFYYDLSVNRYSLVAYVGNDTAPVLPDNIYGSSYRIDYRAFLSNEKIVSVTVPEGVMEIASRAFEGCSSLTDAYFAVTEGWTYDSTKLADSKEAAKILTFLTYTGKSMVRGE